MWQVWCSLFHPFWFYCADKQTHTHTDAAKRFTPATVVGVSNNNTQDSGYGAVIMTESLRELTRFG